MAQGPGNLLEPAEALLRRGIRIIPGIPERLADGQLQNQVLKASLAELIQHPRQARMRCTLQKRAFPGNAGPDRFQRDGLHGGLGADRLFGHWRFARLRSLSSMGRYLLSVGTCLGTRRQWSLQQNDWSRLQPARPVIESTVANNLATFPQLCPELVAIPKTPLGKVLGTRSWDVRWRWENPATIVTVDLLTGTGRLAIGAELLFQRGGHLLGRCDDERRIFFGRRQIRGHAVGHRCSWWGCIGNR